jgi:hypothetical protein
MVLATRPDFTFKFVCQDDQPHGKDRPAPPHATKWQLRLLSRTQRDWCLEKRDRAHEIMDEVCRAGIVGYDQLVDVTGARLAYEEEPVAGSLCGDQKAARHAIKQQILDRISPEVRMELAAAILHGKVTISEDLGN